MQLVRRPRGTETDGQSSRDGDVTPPYVDGMAGPSASDGRSSTLGQLSGWLSALADRFGQGKLRESGAAGEEPQLTSLGDEDEAGERGHGMRLGTPRAYLRHLLQEAKLFLRPRTFTLSVESNLTRIVVFEGREVVAWGIADPEASAQYWDDLPEGRDDSEEVRKRYLLDQLRLRHARLVTDLPLYVPLTRQLKLPEMRRRYLKSVVMSEVAESIPFAPDEVDVKWRLEGDRPDSSVYATVVQKEVIDGHVQRLTDASIRYPAATYSQAAALAEAANAPDSIVVHLGREQAAIVLIRDRNPQVVHQVLLPKADKDSQARAEALARGVQQIVGFEQSVADVEIGQLRPLVLTGEVPGDTELGEELQNILGRDVLPLSPNISYPDDFPISEYAANVGLALLDRANPRWWRALARDGQTSLNLLSERHIPRRVPATAIGVFVALTFFALSAFNFTPRVDALTAEAAEAGSEVERKERLQRLHSLGKASAAKVEAESLEILQATLILEAHRGRLIEEMATLGAFFERIRTITVTSRPEDVIVSNLSPKGDEFTLTASAPTFEGAIQYAENIRLSGLFVGVSVRKVSSDVGVTVHIDTGDERKAGDAVVDFVIQASAKPPPEDQEETSGE